MQKNVSMVQGACLSHRVECPVPVYCACSVVAAQVVL